MDDFFPDRGADALKKHLSDVGQESSILIRDTFLGDEIEKAAERAIDAEGGLIFMDGTDEFGGDGFGVEHLFLLLGVSEAEGFVSFGAKHAAAAAVDGGEAAAIFIENDGLSDGGRFLFSGHNEQSPFMRLVISG